MTQQQVRAQVTVRVKLFADLRRFLPKGHGGPLHFTLPEGATIADLIELIGIPPRDEITAGVDEKLAQRDTVLRDGDEVLLFSPMEGGSDASMNQAECSPSPSHWGGQGQSPPLRWAGRESERKYSRPSRREGRPQFRSELDRRRPELRAITASIKTLREGSIG